MDIDLLSKMVKELILDRDEVNLPGVGTFVAELVPATFSDKGYTINPPYRRLYFVQSQETGDTAIAELYSKSNNVEESKAKKIIVDFLSEMMEVLKEKKVIIFPGLGRLRATRENNFFFVADEDLDIFPSGFGLEPISLKSHEETAAEVSAAIQGLSSIVNDKPEAAPSPSAVPTDASAAAVPEGPATDEKPAPETETPSATSEHPEPTEHHAETTADIPDEALDETPATEEPAPVEHPVDAETPAATAAPDETPAETETPAQTNEPVSTAEEAEAEKPAEPEEVAKEEATEETEAEEKPAAAVEAPSETEPARESVEPETETKPEQEAQTESEAKAEAEPETIAAPETQSETETEPETKTEHGSESSAESKPETEAAAETKTARKPMSLGIKILIWTLSIIVGLLLLWILIGHLAPDFVDKILFNEEELEIINYTLPQS